MKQWTAEGRGVNREGDFDANYDLGPLRNEVPFASVKLILLEQDASFRDVFDAMERGHSEVTGIVLFVDGEGKLSGLLTYRDITRLLLEVDLEAPAFPFATPRAKIEWLQSGDSISFLLRSMTNHLDGYRHVPFLDDDGKPLGVYLLRELLFIVRTYLGTTDTVADIKLNLTPDLLVKKSDSLQTVIEKLNASRERAVLILDDEQETLLGIITEWDVICAFFRAEPDSDPSSLLAETVMVPHPATCLPSDTLTAVSNRLISSRHHQLPVVDADGKLHGLLFARSIVDFVVDGSLQQEVLCSSPSRSTATSEAAGA